MGKISSKMNVGKKSKYEINCEREKSSAERGITCTSGVLTLSEINNDLAVRLHRFLGEGKGNVFFSPFGISTAMAMLFCAAEGETEDELRKALGHEDAVMEKEEIIPVFKQHMLELIQSKDSYTFISASSLITQKDFKIKDQYKSVLKETFKASILEVDFRADGNSVIGKINNWVKKKTNNMIQNTIDSLYPDTIMVLLNATYFKGNWLQNFDEALTSPGNFYNNGNKKNSITVAMMHIKETFIFFQTETFQSLHLPYADDITMLIVLPRKKDGLEELEAKLSPSFFNGLCTEIIGEEVEVSLPRFRLEYFKNLVPYFQNIGITKLFNRGAELNGASDSQELVVSEIFHKAVLEVNEKGNLESSGLIGKCSIRCREMDPFSFIVDHPFLFAIYENKSKLILFLGRVTEL